MMNNTLYHIYVQQIRRWANAFEDILLESRDKISQRLITSLHREN